MWFKYPLAIVVFVVLAMIQNSILPHLWILGYVPNLIFILFFVQVFFEPQKEFEFGFWMAILAGALMDIFLPPYFGVSIICLLVIYCAVKTAQQLLSEVSEDFSIFSFIPMFSASFLIFGALVYFASILLGFQINFGLKIDVIISLILNLAAACIMFYIYRAIFIKERNDNQLKLL